MSQFILHMISRRRQSAALLSLAIVLLLLPFSSIHAQDQTTITPQFTEIASDEFYRAKILTITEAPNEGSAEDPVARTYVVKARILNGADKSKEVEFTHYDSFGTIERQKTVPGDTVVLTKTYDYTGVPLYYLLDIYRIPSLKTVLGIFFFLALIFGRKKGLSSIVGLGISIFILIKYVVPQILTGSNPVFVSLIGSTVIAVFSIFLAHGFKKRTTVAVVSTLITLWLAAVLAWIFVSVARLTGFGTEEALLLAAGPLENINLSGLLLAGIIIGALGVLDDITTAQAATIDEIKKANPAISRTQLYRHGLSVGREHISSLINTLVLAYAGASFPLLLLFSFNPRQPAWVVLNSEFMAEEIVRTLVGSSALILAVPITTLLATYVFSRQK